MLVWFGVCNIGLVLRLVLSLWFGYRRECGVFACLVGKMAVMGCNAVRMVFAVWLCGGKLILRLFLALWAGFAGGGGN